MPVEIRSHFAQAINLAVYSWFYYPFNVTAHFMGLVSVVFALKVKTESRKPFRKLLREAVDAGWITDDGFKIARHRGVLRNHTSRYW